MLDTGKEGDCGIALTTHTPLVKMDRRASLMFLTVAFLAFSLSAVSIGAGPSPCDVVPPHCRPLVLWLVALRLVDASLSCPRAYSGVQQGSTSVWAILLGVLPPRDGLGRYSTVEGVFRAHVERGADRGKLLHDGTWIAYSVRAFQYCFGEELTFFRVQALLALPVGALSCWDQDYA